MLVPRDSNCKANAKSSQAVRTSGLDFPFDSPDLILWKILGATHPSGNFDGLWPMGRLSLLHKPYGTRTNRSPSCPLI